MSSTQTVATNFIAGGNSQSDQYLSFILAGEEYGISILQVQEIKAWETATPIPNMPDFILGVINLRGTIVPVIDLRRRFGLESIPSGPSTVVIVVKIIDTNGKERTMSMVADAVSEVYDVASADLQPAPDFGEVVGSTSITGLATIDEKMIILLDINHLMGSEIPAIGDPSI